MSIKKRSVFQYRFGENKHKKNVFQYHFGGKKAQKNTLRGVMVGDYGFEPQTLSV